MSSHLTVLPHSVSGVIHAAGVDMYASLAELDHAQLCTVLAPKACGTLNLQHDTASSPLAHFGVFSSASALVGLKGGSLYAAANSCLDSFVQCQRASGTPAQGIQWGAWTQIGMAAGIDANGYILAGSPTPSGSM